MNLEELKSKIDHRTARLSVIGLGFVGLPVAAIFAKEGFNVLGVEIREDRVEKINAGLSPIEGEEPGLAEMLADVVASKMMRATSNYEDLGDRDIILIDVETPVDDDHFPHYEALSSSLRSLGKVMKEGALVIIESTIAPGTMETFVLPILEEASGRKLNNGFHLGCCPERVMPGKLLANLTNLSRVVGGGSPGTSEVMLALYRYVVKADLDAADWVTAELVKTTENAYRDVQIAFANEVALICEALGGDVWKVRELVNKSPYRSMHMPGAGVGGHCIPKDPWLLAYGVREKDVNLRMIPAARSVNDGMPLYLADLTAKMLTEAGRNVKESQILVLGYSYLEDSEDTRNSPSEVLIRRLEAMGAKVIPHDPYITEYQGDLYSKAKGCDAVVIMVAHSVYKSLDFERIKSGLRTPILIIGRPLFDDSQLALAHHAFQRFHQIGIGK